MIDPNNVLLRCPNGHDLQAARSDLHQDLACPVCNVVFSPQAAFGKAAAAVNALPVDYAHYQMPPQTLKYPAVTGWMIGLWIIVVVGVTVIGLTMGQVSSDFDPKNPGMGLMLGAGALLCLCFPASIAAVVLNLIWVYRIHRDAEQYGRYTAISPGLALGLGLIPIVNLVWVGWTMRKLGQFAADGERHADPVAMRASHATRTCFITSIVLALVISISVSLSYAAKNQAEVTLADSGLKVGSPEYMHRMQELMDFPLAIKVADTLIRLVCVAIYLYSVRALEASLYPKLGATPK